MLKPLPFRHSPRSFIDAVIGAILKASLARRNVCSEGGSAATEARAARSIAPRGSGFRISTCSRTRSRRVIRSVPAFGNLARKGKSFFENPRPMGVSSSKSCSRGMRDGTYNPARRSGLWTKTRINGGASSTNMRAICVSGAPRRASRLSSASTRTTTTGSTRDRSRLCCLSKHEVC